MTEQEHELSIAGRFEATPEYVSCQDRLAASCVKSDSGQLRE